MARTVWLGHGASGTSESMRPWVDGLRKRGIRTRAIELPRRKAEDAVPALRQQVPSSPNAVVGGHSFGGRVASLAAAQPGAKYAALILLSYPLHRPGAPETWEQRTAHWPGVRCPVLMLSGESDPFARIDLLRGAAPLLAAARLHTWPGLGHSLKPVLDEAIDRVAAFLEEI
jgi:predicted alpha/beta-hydrolase family hydrolase